MANPKTGYAYNAAETANKVSSLILTSGTIGTSDTSGTAETIRASGDPTTGAQYVYNLGPAGSISFGGTDPAVYMPARLTDGTNFYVGSSGGGGGSNVNIFTGTQQTLGTVGTLIGAGTVTNVGSLTNLGTAKEVTTVANLTNGSVNILTGTVTALTNGSVNVLTGTIQSSGTTTGVGVVTALTTGSVTVTNGTITTGTIQNIASGTINALASGTITAGTVSSKISLTPAAPAVGTVGTISAQLVGSNTNRKGLILINTSGNTVNIAFNAAAVGTTGIHLTPMGVYYMDEYSFNLGTVNAIATAITSLVTIQEFNT